MSLKAFHVVFISASALLSFGLAAWCFDSAPEGSRLGAGLAAVTAGVGLAVYEAWFVRKMRRLP